MVGDWATVLLLMRLSCQAVAFMAVPDFRDEQCVCGVCAKATTRFACLLYYCAAPLICLRSYYSCTHMMLLPLSIHLLFEQLEFRGHSP